MLSEQAAREAAEACGYQQLETLRVARTVVFCSEGQAIKVIPLSWRAREHVEREHSLMRWLNQQGFPCPQQQSPLQEKGGMIVVAYQLLETVQQLDWREFGALIKRLHQLTPPRSMQTEAAALNIAGAHRERIGYERLGLSREEKALLLRQISDAESLLGGHHPEVLCHGDAHPGNLLQSEEGLVLIDFEKAGRGPRQVDLASAFARSRRFGLPQERLEEWLEGYGEAEYDQSTLAFQMLSEVGGILYLSGADDPALQAEAKKRLRSLLGNGQEIWKDK